MARKVKFDFTLSDFLDGKRIRLPADRRAALEEDVLDLISTEILTNVGEGRSPVTGRRFKKLTDAYAARKSSEGGTVLGGQGSNLELTGALLDAFKTEKTRSGKLRVTVEDDEQPKADGHNNFSGKSKLPRRPFIPDAKEGEFFAKSVRESVRALIESRIGGG